MTPSHRAFRFFPRKRSRNKITASQLRIRAFKSITLGRMVRFSNNKVEMYIKDCSFITYSVPSEGILFPRLHMKYLQH